MLRVLCSIRFSYRTTQSIIKLNINENEYDICCGYKFLFIKFIVILLINCILLKCFQPEER